MGRVVCAVVLAVVCAACNEPARLQPVHGSLRASPPRQDFGGVALHGERLLNIRLQNVGRADVAIRSLAIEGVGREDFRLEHSLPVLEAGQAYVLPIVFRPSAVGPREAVIRLLTDSPETPAIVLNATGLGVDARAIPEQWQLEFGRVEIEATRTLELVLSNDSMLPVTIGFSIRGGAGTPFRVAGPHRIEGHAKAKLDVSFSPVSAGEARAELELVPCEGCRPVTVALAGTGIDSALVVTPEQLHFGGVAVDQKVERTVMVENVSDLPVQLRSVALHETDHAFSLLSPPGPMVLAPGDRHEATVRYGPTHLGLARGTLHLDSDSKRRPRIEVPITGDGGGAEIAVSPDVLDFGQRPDGSRTLESVRIMNMGSTQAAELVLHRVEIDGDGAFAASLPATPMRLKSGEFVDVPVYFEPAGARDHTGRLLIHSSDSARPVVPVTLLGSGRTLEPCQVRFAPEVVDFGSLEPGRAVSLGIRVENVGNDLCAVKNLQVVDDAGGAFWLSGSVPPGFELKPNRWFIRHVSFQGHQPGNYAGRIRMEISNPFAPTVEIPMRASVQASCLVPDPRRLQFGVVRSVCPPKPLTVNWSNVCSSPLLLDDIWVGEGTGDDFEVTRKPTMPLLLLPGQTVPVEVRYRAGLLGENLAPLFATNSSTREPVLVPMHGQTYFEKKAIDDFIQQASNRIDVLFVVDNSESMVEEQPRLKAAMPAFLAAARAAGMDMQVGVTTTGLREVPGGNCPGGVRGGEAGRLFPVDHSRPRVVTPTAPFAAQTLQQNVEVGFCHSYEQAFEAMKLALSPPLVDSHDDPRTPEPLDGNAGFYRDEAALAVVFVSDEDDHSGADVDDYVDFLRRLKGPNQPHRVSAYAIAPTAQGCATAGGQGHRYAEIAARTGGEVLSVCEPDFSPALARVAGRAFGPQEAFALSEIPVEATLEVFVDGRAVTAGWQYRAADNTVLFDAGSVPAAGARIQVVYDAVCGPGAP